MDINKCNIYFGNKKIKTIYFGPYKVYEDGKIPGLYFLEFGNNIASPIKHQNIVHNSTVTLNFLEIGSNIASPILNQ